MLQAHIRLASDGQPIESLCHPRGGRTKRRSPLAPSSPTIHRFYSYIPGTGKWPISTPCALDCLRAKERVWCKSHAFRVPCSVSVMRRVGAMGRTHHKKVGKTLKSILVSSATRRRVVEPRGNQLARGELGGQLLRSDRCRPRGGIYRRMSTGIQVTLTFGRSIK